MDRTATEGAKEMGKDVTPATEGELLIYPAAGGAGGIRVLLAGETVWLTQAQIAALYQTTPQNITQHLKAIYGDGELDESTTCKDYLQVRQEGGRTVSRRPKHYRLEAILAVGYRVRSSRGTEFRQWATTRLSEYLVKGFVLDDERLKGTASAVDHFDELLARIRDIRASEARVYQRIREIFAMAVDYREGDQATQRFFAIGWLGVRACFDSLKRARLGKSTGLASAALRSQHCSKHTSKVWPGRPVSTP